MTRCRSSKRDHARHAAIGLLLLSAALGGSATNDWPRYARNGRLTSHSPLIGSLSAPRLAWTAPVNGIQLILEIHPARGIHPFSSENGQTQPATLRVSGPPNLDRDGQGHPRASAESYHERWARVLPDVPGWQRVAWSHVWTDQKVGRLQLFAYDQNPDQPRLVWETDPPEDTLFQPLNVVQDIDKDGVQEICVAAHYRVMIFEGTTGRKETELRYHQSRPYGWFGVLDVDGDDRPELITIGDFQSHLDVLDYDPAKPEKDRLSVRWRRDIEQQIEKRTRWPKVGPEPVVNLLGDSTLEMVISLYNDAGDGQWHTLILNAATGETLRDHPKRCLQGTADLDADGQHELFLVESAGVFVPQLGHVELVQPAHNRVLMERQLAGWATTDRQVFQPHWSTTAAEGLRQVVTAEAQNGEPPAFALWSHTGSYCLSAYRLEKGREPVQLWEVSQFPEPPEIMTLAADGEGIRAKVRLAVPAGKPCSLTAANASVQLVEQHSIGGLLAPPIAARLEPNGPMILLTEGAAGYVYAIKPGSSGSPEMLWHHRGRGMSDGSRHLGLVTADLDGDNASEVIIATSDTAGRARLTALRHDRSVLWEHPFPQIPGMHPVWNAAALTFWWPGHFRDATQLDLFVNTRRGLMHSDVGHLLDGRTGKVLWTRERAAVPGEFDWGYGGIPPGVADFDLDGPEEIVSLYPVCFWVADGATGKLRSGRELASQRELPAWAAYGEPMILGPANDLCVLLDSPYLLAMLDRTGQPRWHAQGRPSFPTKAEEARNTTQTRHALLDLDGDGIHEVASAGYGDGARAYDPKNGQLLWSLPAPAPTCPRVVSANIDGLPGDELIYAASQEIIAIAGDRTQGRILWRWTAPAALSMPIVADLDDDGAAEIAVLGADGLIRCLDSE